MAKMLALTFPYDSVLVEKIKTIPRRRWDAEHKRWLIPAQYRAYAEQLITAWQAGPPVVTKPQQWTFATEPWPWQLAGLEYAYDKPAVLLDMYMRLGKSKVAIDICVNRQHKKVLIICPKSVVPVWVQQCERHGGGRLSAMQLDTGSVQKNLAIAKRTMRETRAAAYIINYESVWREPFGAWALEQDWDVIIADEVHRLAGAGTRQSTFLYRLSFRATQRLGLSGTPLRSAPEDAYGVYRFLAPEIFGTNKKKFLERYAVMGGYGGYQILSYVNQEEFQRKFDSIRYHAGKELLDIPVPQDIDIPVALPPAAQKLYRELDKEFYVEVERGEVTAANVLVKLLRLRQLTSGFLGLDGGECEEVHTAKKTALYDILRGLPEYESVVVFAWAINDLKAICDIATLAGRQYYELSGRYKEHTRWSCGGVLGVQIAAGGVGLDFSRARYCVFYSVSWSLAEYDQAQSRMQSVGQQHQITYYHLIVPNSVDEKAYKAFKKRRDIIDAIVNREEV